MDFILLIVGWIIFAHVFAELAPLVFELFCCAIKWVFLVIWTALIFVLGLLAKGVAITLKAICRGLWKAAAIILKAFGRGLWNVALFAWLFIDELWRGPEADADQAYDHDDADGARNDDDEEEAAADAYAAALTLLGLDPGFTRDALKRAYKQLMRKAHPDVAGGSTEAAQAVNAARDLVMTAHGWT